MHFIFSCANYLSTIKFIFFVLMLEVCAAGNNQVSECDLSFYNRVEKSCIAKENDQCYGFSLDADTVEFFGYKQSKLDQELLVAAHVVELVNVDVTNSNQDCPIVHIVPTLEHESLSCDVFKEEFLKPYLEKMRHKFIAQYLEEKMQLVNQHFLQVLEPEALLIGSQMESSYSQLDQAQMEEKLREDKKTKEDSSGVPLCFAKLKSHFSDSVNEKQKEKKNISVVTQLIESLKFRLKSLCKYHAELSDTTSIDQEVASFKAQDLRLCSQYLTTNLMQIICLWFYEIVDTKMADEAAKAKISKSEIDLNIVCIENGNCYLLNLGQFSSLLARTIIFGANDVEFFQTSKNGNQFVVRDATMFSKKCLEWGKKQIAFNRYAFKHYGSSVALYLTKNGLVLQNVEGRFGVYTKSGQLVISLNLPDEIVRYFFNYGYEDTIEFAIKYLDSFSHYQQQILSVFDKIEAWKKEHHYYPQEA